MTDRAAPRDCAHQELVGEMRAYTRRRLAQVGLRLARSLAQRFVGDSDGAAAAGLADPARDALLPALAFAERFRVRVAAGRLFL